MDRDEILGLYERKHHLLLLLTGVAGNMKLGITVINDLCALVEKLVDYLTNHVFVARDGRCRYDDTVAGFNVYLTVLGKRHTVQSGHGLALTAGRDNDDLVFR